LTIFHRRSVAEERISLGNMKSEAWRTKSWLILHFSLNLQQRYHMEKAKSRKIAVRSEKRSERGVGVREIFELLK